MGTEAKGDKKIGGGRGEEFRQDEDKFVKSFQSETTFGGGDAAAVTGRRREGKKKALLRRRIR